MESKTLNQKTTELIMGSLNKEYSKKTGNNYGLDDYVTDFEGTDEELAVELIKQAAKIL